MGNILSCSVCSTKTRTEYTKNELRRLRKQENIKRKTDTSEACKATSLNKSMEISISGTQPFLPIGIIIEILIRLPIKSLLRMKSVCKYWNALMHERYFVEKHMILTHIHHFYDDDFSNMEPFEKLRGCHGLLLLKTSNKYFIYNPATRQGLFLPDPHEDFSSLVLVFVASTNEYKLVITYPINGNCDSHDYEGCKVLTLGNDKSWRPLAFPQVFHDLNKEEESVSTKVCSHSVHFIRLSNIGSNICKEIVSLDLHSETFTTATLPQAFFSNWSEICPLNWNGDLGFAHLVQGNLNILVLKDYKRPKWDNEEIVFPLSALVKIKPEFLGDVFFWGAWAEYGDFRFLLYDHGFYSYKFESKEVVQVFPLPMDSTIYRKLVYVGSASLVTLTGMKHHERNSTV